MSQPQSYKNHMRFMPLYHYVLLPILLLNLAFCIYLTVHHWPEHRHLFSWSIVMALALLLLANLARDFPLKAQDRIVRLEERLRLTALGVPPEITYALTEKQLIGLRFASDAELPALATRAVAENLTLKQIKQSIQNWRPDYFRI